MIRIQEIDDPKAGLMARNGIATPYQDGEIPA